MSTKITLFYVFNNEATKGESAETLDIARNRAALLTTNPEVKFIQVKVMDSETHKEVRHQWFRNSGKWTTKEVTPEVIAPVNVTPEMVANLGW